MDILKNISRERCSFLDSLPQAEKDRISADIIQRQEWIQGLLTVRQLCELLSMGRDGIVGLPLKFKTPFRKTSRGRRQVRSVHKDDLVTFLSSLNPTFGNFDPLAEQLLKLSEAKELYGNDLPEYVQISERVRRYRPRSVPTIAAPSELVMEGLS